MKDRYFPHDTSSVQASLSGLLTASLLLGAFVGCFLGVDFGNRFGRRVAFRITAAITIVMSVLLAVVPSFEALVILRTLLGLAVGLATALCPWYVTDAIPANIRGSIGTIFQVRNRKCSQSSFQMQSQGQKSCCLLQRSHNRSCFSLSL